MAKLTDEERAERFGMKMNDEALETSLKCLKEDIAEMSHRIDRILSLLAERWDVDVEDID